MRTSAAEGWRSGGAVMMSTNSWGVAGSRPVFLVRFGLVWPGFGSVSERRCSQLYLDFEVRYRPDFMPICAAVAALPWVAMVSHGMAHQARKRA